MWKFIKDSFATQVAIITILIYTSLGFIVYGVHSYTNNESDELHSSENTGLYLLENNNCVVLVDSINNNSYNIHNCISKEPSFTRLLSQLRIVRNRYMKHSETMTFFIQQRYLFNTLQAFMIMVTTIIGLYIAKEGMDKTNKLVIISFFIFGGCLAFVEVVPSTLNIDHNIENNKRKCKVYMNMETDILTYISINEVNNVENVTMNNFIHDIDTQLKHEYNIAFDINGIPDNYQFDYQYNNSQTK
jgi:hypothetical protein